jgi:hypothetical protein
MNKPENEMLLCVLEKKTSKTGKDYYTGFLGLNSVYVSEYEGKLWVKLQKWPKKDPAPQSQAPQIGDDDVSF